MALTKTPAEVIVDGLDVSKVDLRRLLDEMNATISGGGGGENIGAGYDVAYVNFADKPDGALLSTITWDTGHTLAGISGPGAETVAVTNSDGQSGYVSSPDGTFYAVLNWPHTNFVASMLVSWDDDGVGPGMALGCGKYVDGQIIAKMVHAQSNFNNPFLTLWGTGHDTPGQPNLLESYITPQNAYYDRTPLPEVLDKVRITAIVIGDYMAFFYNGQSRVKQFHYLGEAGSPDRDGAISTLVGDYIYYETTYNAHCRVHDMYAKELTISDWSQVYPKPLPLPLDPTTSQIVTKAIPKNTKTEICRFTVAAGQAARVLVDLLASAAGDVSMYASGSGSYSFAVTRYGNPAVGPSKVGPTQIGADQNPTNDGGTLTITPTFYVDLDGNDVVLSAKAQAGGSNASSYSPVITLRVTFTGTVWALTATP